VPADSGAAAATVESGTTAVVSAAVPLAVSSPLPHPVNTTAATGAIHARLGGKRRRPDICMPKGMASAVPCQRRLAQPGRIGLGSLAYTAGQLQPGEFRR
jgi:hypothetical protein